MKVRAKKAVDVVSGWASARGACALRMTRVEGAPGCPVQPPPIQAFIDSVLKEPLSSIGKPLQGFAWTFDNNKVCCSSSLMSVCMLQPLTCICMLCLAGRIHTVGGAVQQVR
jgi:hypothetical protein